MGGGSSAGRIDFPTHMKTVHQDWLNQTGTDTIEASMVDKMNATMGSSPYASMAAYNPATPINNMLGAVSTFNTRVDALSPQADWENAVDAVAAKVDSAIIDDTTITNDITAFSNILEDRLVNEILPRFQSGMRDVNAVMSSAFVIGEAIIEGMMDKEVAKYGTDLRLRNNVQRNEMILKGVESVLRDIHALVELEKNVSHYTIEANRLKIVAEKEKKDTENNISIKNGRWDIETFQYGANLLASIGGGTVVPTGGDNPGTLQSAIGGALSGAALGSAVSGGNAWATGGGAIIGGLLGGLF